MKLLLIHSNKRLQLKLAIIPNIIANLKSTIKFLFFFFSQYNFVSALFYIFLLDISHFLLLSGGDQQEPEAGQQQPRPDNGPGGAHQARGSHQRRPVRHSQAEEATYHQQLGDLYSMSTGFSEKTSHALDIELLCCNVSKVCHDPGEAM